MNQPPSTMTVELDEHDLHKDFLEITESMGAIRNEGLRDRNIAEEKKNEYLHLAYRLVSNIKAQADEELVKKMQRVVQALEQNPPLINYDFMQDGFWREVLPDFTRQFDQVAIRLSGDDFRGLEEKHHLMNALKYLGTQEEPLERRLVIYDTVLPYNTPQPTKEVQKRIGKVGNIKFDGLTIFVGNRTQNLERILESASESGFKGVRCVVDGEESIKGLGKKYKVKVVQHNFSETDDPNNSGLTRLLGKLVKKTKFVSYPVLGFLPSSLQRRIETSFKKAGVQDAYNSGRAFLVSSWLENLSVFAGGITLANTYGPSWAWIPTTAYALVNGIGRGIMRGAGICGGHGEGKTCGRCLIRTNEGPCGDMLVKPIFFPLEKLLDYKCGKIPTHPTLVEIELGDGNSSKSDRVSKHNYHPLMEEIASKTFNPETEQNLIWRLDNHHTQGKYFEKALRESGLNGFGNGQYLAREAGALAIYDTLQSPPYKKVSALVCFPNRRYAVTYVGLDSETLTDFQTVSQVLSNGEPIDKKLESVSRHTKADYIHASQFNEGTKVADLTATNI